MQAKILTLFDSIHASFQVNRFRDQPTSWDFLGGWVDARPRLKKQFARRRAMRQGCLWPSQTNFDKKMIIFKFIL